ncbi:dCMP deaminase family protein [Paraneptunicella aestuarii]|uniref:anti-phage dCTP deaminase n=1 Tax=Paraneptunicella aestuarii TaxID=2831148 RepID=UPI001E4CADA3|nr:anti-phage dCTP deaminase [Paraneptunicella aestuarii]UAA40041.1 dCMP deaminase family protein [Paraneptunicella aestuarii]
MKLSFSGTFVQLKDKLSELGGSWDEPMPNKKVFRLAGGILNWFESTGTIQFQGKAPGKGLLEQRVPSLLYPDQFEEQTIKEQGTKELEAEVSGVSPKSQSANRTIEREYLESNIKDSELIIGIVSAVGTENRLVTEPLQDGLEGFGYSVVEIRVSSILPVFDKSGISKEYKRIRHYMEHGDLLREQCGNNAILAAGVASKIQEERKGQSSRKTAYIINSLKHPSEVELLRKIYGDGFYLFGIHADINRRRNYLKQKNCTEVEANELIQIDEDEKISHGQKTRDTYHLSDFFLNLGRNQDQVKNAIKRFLELIFSHPYKNPTFDEFAMFMAFNSSVRSGDLSRQVGAVVCKDEQIIATGANDVPQFGGGLYWARSDPNTGEVKDAPDGKDYMREEDSNKRTQSEIIEEISKLVVDDNLIEPQKHEQLIQVLRKSKIADLTEFGRIVHAEMEALLSCSRAGVSTKDTTLYCTTFPCHNCAKHIIGSGVKRVVYVEPYPKSKALEFHSESIQLKSNLDGESSHNLVDFEPFIGVGPRRFLDLFSMNLGSGSKLRRKEKEGVAVEWIKENAVLRTPLISKSYIEIESAASEIWNETSLS